MLAVPMWSQCANLQLYSSVIFVTIGRLIFIVRLGASLNTDLSWSFAILIYWYMCEMLVASTCISLPTIFHFVLRGVRHGFRSLFTDREYSQDLPQWTDSDSRTLRNHSHNPSDGFVRLPPKASTGLFRKSGSIGLKQFNGVEAEEIWWSFLYKVVHLAIVKLSG